MTINDVMQLICIFLFIGIICWSIDKLYHMTHDLWFIMVNFIKYLFFGIFKSRWERKYIAPMNWLITNYNYICYLLLIVGEATLTFAFMMQWRMNQVQNKSFIWFVALPLISVAILGLLSYNDVKKKAHTKRSVHV